MQADVLEQSVGVEDALREVSKIRSIVNEAVEDGVRSANQVIKHGRQAAENALEEAKHTVKQKPFQSIGLAFAAGTVAGALFTFIGLRNR